MADIKRKKENSFRNSSYEHRLSKVVKLIEKLVLKRKLILKRKMKKKVFKCNNKAQKKSLACNLLDPNLESNTVAFL